MQGRTLSLVAVIVSVFISTLTFAITTPLLAVRLSAEGFGGGWIGLNTGAGAAAILAVTLFTPALGRRIGSFSAMIASILVMALGVGLLPFLHSPIAWLLLRFLIGAGIAVHWVISEVWVNTVATAADRGRIVGMYVAALGLAYAVAYPLLLAVGTEGNLPFAIVTALIASAALPILLARKLVPVLPPAPAGGALDAIRREPVVMGAALVAGIAIAVVLSFLLLYVQVLGFGERPALLVLSTVALGNVLLQVPIGMLVDRDGGERLLIPLCVIGLAGLAGMPFLASLGLLRWPFLFAWGGALGGFYTLSLTMLGRRFTGDALPAANAAFVLVYEIGGLLGPILTGVSFDLWAPHGALVVLALAYSLFIVAGMRRKAAAA